MHKRVKNRDILLKIIDAIGNLPQGLLYEHTATGNPATFSTNVAKAIAMAIPFSPVQDLHGYDYPWPAGAGKNKFDPVNGDFGLWTDGTGTVTDNQTAYISPFIKINAESYSASKKTDVALYSWSFVFYDANKDFISRTHASAGEYSTFASGAIPTGAVYFKFQCARSTLMMTQEYLASLQIQVEEGTTVTTYAPYSNICPISGFTGCNIIVSPTLDAEDGTTYAVSWSDEAGTVYGGSLTVYKDGTGVLAVEYEKITLNGTEQWNSLIEPSSYRYYNSTIKTGTYTDDKNVISNYLANKESTSGEATFIQSGNSTSQNINVYHADIINGSIVDVTSWKTYLASNPLEVVYKLDTPVTHTLTVEQIKTLLGTNNIWTNTNGTNTIKYLKRG